MATTTTTTAKPGNGIPDSPLVTAFKAARRVSTPILAIETPDAAATILSIRRSLTDKIPVLAWDTARGLKGLNEPGKAALAMIGVDPNATVGLPVEALIAAENLPEFSVLFLHNFHRFTSEAPVVQALWNLRDVFKMNGRTVVTLGPAFVWPAEIGGDVVTLDEPLPTRDELSAILDQQHKNAQLPLPSDDVRAKALDAMVGLAAYTAETAAAMALEKKGINIDKVWDRKIKTIKATPGLSVWVPRPGETSLNELRGIDNVVRFMQKFINAKTFNLIVFMDEMDKAFAGGMSEHSGDGGVAKDQVGTILSYIEDGPVASGKKEPHPGVLLDGVAGTGKTQLAKAIAMASDKPLIILDIGGLKTKYVGASEQALREALKVITAMAAGGKVLFLGTANKTTIFSPEFNRRFPDQFFYDTPTDEARAAIWPVYIAKNKLTPEQAAFPAGFDAGWTGAEIKRMCDRAAEWHETVMDAAKYLIPQSVSAKKEIAALRREAAGRFLSASVEGFYTLPAEDAPVLPVPTRQIAVD